MDNNKHLSEMQYSSSVAEDDSILDECKRCGKCCQLRVFVAQKAVVYTGIRCQYLTANNLCSIYDNRPSWCLSAEQMKDKNMLPDDCGYNQGG